MGLFLTRLSRHTREPQMRTACLALVASLLSFCAAHPEHDARVAQFLQQTSDVHPFRQVPQDRYYNLMPHLTLNPIDATHVSAIVRVVGKNGYLSTHINSKTDYIKSIWVRDERGNTPWLQEFASVDVSTTELPLSPIDLTTISGSFLIPYSWCSNHGIWEGPAIQIRAKALEDPEL
eukprot:c10025_g1_i1.p1 GENE.c10025_g1_i1~~c10025_g1_i1.p1  ORF type:complete len:177 (+),score=27.11 c10025_g1_i1:1-531(+)